MKALRERAREYYDPDEIEWVVSVQEEQRSHYEAYFSAEYGELAAYVCSKLEEEDIETVLSGGSCVQIYSKGKYTSADIDLIDRFNGGHTLIKNVMFDMGFKEHNRYFVHDDTEWFIEFPRGL